MRQQDGSLKGYNTDWSAAITAIEDGLQSHGAAQRAEHSQRDADADSVPTSVDSAAGLGAEEATTSGRVWSSRGGEEGGQGGSVLEGRTVVVVGAGGAGRALAFGAAHKGAKVIIANR